MQTSTDCNMIDGPRSGNEEKLMEEVVYPRQIVTCVAFSDDGKELAFGCKDYDYNEYNDDNEDFGATVTVIYTRNGLVKWRTVLHKSSNVKHIFFGQYVIAFVEMERNASRIVTIDMSGHVVKSEISSSSPIQRVSKPKPGILVYGTKSGELYMRRERTPTRDSVQNRSFLRCDEDINDYACIDATTVITALEGGHVVKWTKGFHYNDRIIQSPRTDHNAAVIKIAVHISHACIAVATRDRKLDIVHVPSWTIVGSATLYSNVYDLVWLHHNFNIVVILDDENRTIETWDWTGQQLARIEPSPIHLGIDDYANCITTYGSHGIAAIGTTEGRVKIMSTVPRLIFQENAELL